MSKQEEGSGMSNSTKYLITFFGGLAAGTALGLYLNSQQGKEFREKITSQLTDLEAEIEDKVNMAIEEISSRVNNSGLSNLAKKATGNEGNGREEKAAKETKEA